MSVRAATPGVLAVRSAVEGALSDLTPGDAVLVAVSGGADSLALAGATAWAAPRLGLAARAVVVDHGLQAESAAVAAWAARTCARLGLAEASVVSVRVDGAGGPEAAARDARYAALAAAADGVRAVLLGHTREDQAETVLLRLSRGSGARALSAMRERTGLWRRPFLRLARADVHAAASDLLGPLGEQPWRDPHNVDRGFGRVRVRGLLESGELGPGAVVGLARSADLLRDDADALDGWAQREFDRVVDRTVEGPVADCSDLLALPRAIRTRVIRLMGLACGSPAADLGVDHIARVEALVVDWHGQGEVSLPGRVRASRACGRLSLHPST